MQLQAENIDYRKEVRMAKEKGKESETDFRKLNRKYVLLEKPDSEQVIVDNGHLPSEVVEVLILDVSEKGYVKFAVLTGGRSKIKYKHIHESMMPDVIEVLEEEMKTL